MEGDDIGYVRLTSFNEQTDAGLRRADPDPAPAGRHGLKGLVLDLRNNPGGLLDQAVQVSDDFLDQGEIVSTRARRSEDAQRWNAKRRRHRPGPADRRADQRRLAPRPPRSSPARCRTTAARSSSA